MLPITILYQYCKTPTNSFYLLVFEVLKTWISIRLDVVKKCDNFFFTLKLTKFLWTSVLPNNSFSRIDFEKNLYNLLSCWYCGINIAKNWIFMKTINCENLKSWYCERFLLKLNIAKDYIFTKIWIWERLNVQKDLILSKKVFS